MIAGYSNAAACQITVGAVFARLRRTSPDVRTITWPAIQETISGMSYDAARDPEVAERVWARYFAAMDTPENYRLWLALKRALTRELRERQQSANFRGGRHAIVTRS